MQYYPIFKYWALDPDSLDPFSNETSSIVRAEYIEYSTILYLNTGHLTQIAWIHSVMKLVA